MEPSLTTFDPHTVNAEELAERFPDIGLFVAEDIVDWRRKNEGAFPDERTLLSLGLGTDVAQHILGWARAAEPASVEDTSAPAVEESTAEEPPAPVVSRLPAYALQVSEPPAPAPARTVFDVAAAPANVVDESEVEDAPESRPAKTPPPPPAVVAAPVSAPPAPESAPHVAHAESAPPVAHAESAPPVAPSVPVAAAAPKRAKRAGLVAMLVTVNLAAIAGVAAGYQQERGTRKEVVTISTDVGVVKVEQTAAKERADEALAKLEEARTRLDAQEKLLAQTKARVAAAEARLQEDERAAHEREAQDAKENAALNSRVIRVEDKTVKLDEALKLLENFDR